MWASGSSDFTAEWSHLCPSYVLSDRSLTHDGPWTPGLPQIPLIGTVELIVTDFFRIFSLNCSMCYSTEWRLTQILMLTSPELMKMDINEVMRTGSNLVWWTSHEKRRLHRDLHRWLATEDTESPTNTCTPGTQALEGMRLACTLWSGFRSPELWRNMFLS